ncbi:Signal transduction response regulator [Parasponia andersonii]|uniref:Signal transduction response regulator n=1 Tax=Parasponia andersonii TaxID=3476 RepID=A0A2P5CCA6_PARAD|nr:Signal transduction response regulator [Parasponia andersonii]
MGFSGAYSLCSHSSFSKPKLFDPKHGYHKSLKPSLTKPQVENPFILPIKLLTLSKPSRIVTHFSKSPALTPPFSNDSKFSFFLSPQKNFHRFFLEKIVGFVFGTVFFIGFFNMRAAYALPAQTSSSSVNVEEKRDTQRGDIENEELYEEILKKEPKNVEALMVVLYGKMRRGETKEAVKYVERLIKLEPEEVEWKLLLALSYETMGQLTMAKRLFKEILKERPLLLRALHGLALVMHKSFEGPAVFEMLNKALELARREKKVTEERNIRILIAQMHVVRGALEEGLKEFQTLVNEDHRDFRPYLCMGIIYSLLDKKEEAAEQFETYRSLVPEEFPQRGFLDDVVLAAKTKSREQLQKEFQNEYSNWN